MIAIKILAAVDMCFYVYMMMIIARCLLTWLPGLNWDNPFLKALTSAVDLYLDLFRKFIPPLGPFDLSPMVAMFLIYYVRLFVVNGLYIGFIKLGLIGS